MRTGDPLFRLLDAGTVYIAVTVPEAELPRLRQAQEPSSSSHPARLGRSAG